MLGSRLSLLTGAFLLTLGSWLSFGCAGDAFQSDSGEGGAAATGGAAGTGSRSGSGGGPPIGASCKVDTDCVAAINWADPCFSPDCSVPIPASKVDVAQETCVADWTERYENRPEQCGADEVVACPLACAQPPTCMTARCVSGSCALDLGYSASDCGDNGSGGSGSSDCDELNTVRAERLESARSCIPGGIIPECDGNVSILDDCGCSVVVNENAPSRVKEAQDAYTAWNKSCEPPPRCAALDCLPAGTSSSCVPDKVDGLTGRCQ